MSQAEHTNQHEEAQENPNKYQEVQRLQMSRLRQKHPDCVPVFFTKHVKASQTLKEPEVPFILFNKDLKIEQAMYRLYEQIQQKGLIFFCLNNEPEKKTNYIRLQPGPTIEQIFNRYGKNNYLMLIYADSEFGMQGLKKMEKCMLWLLGILGTIWVLLYGASYYLSWQGQPVSQSPGAAGMGAERSQEWMEDIN